MRTLAYITLLGIAVLASSASEPCRDETVLLGEVVAFDRYAGMFHLTNEEVRIPIVLRIVANLKGPATEEYIVAEYVGTSGSEKALPLKGAEGEPVVLSLKICRAKPESISTRDLTTSEAIEDGKEVVVDPLEYVDVSARRQWGDRLPVFEFGPEDYKVLTIEDFRKHSGD